MSEEAFRGLVHMLAVSLFAVMAAYNVMRWCDDHELRHLINALIYSPLWGFEIYQTFLHWWKP